jgi:hypothetical protein
MLVIALFMAFFLAAPAFASGNLTVVSHSIAPLYINTNSSTAMMNITLNSTSGNVTVTGINITFLNNSANVALVQIVNATDILGSSSAFVDNVTSIQMNYNVTSAANATIGVVILLNSSAPSGGNVSLNISSAGVDAGSNVTLDSVPASSRIQNLHATAFLSPLFVDTGVVNQSLSYIFAPTGTDGFANVSISVPVQYVLVNVTEVRKGTTIYYNENISTASVFFNRSSGAINISNIPLGNPDNLTVSFLVNTSSSFVDGIAVNSTISGSNISSVAAQVIGSNTTLYTFQMANITNVKISKGVAIANGTDYWEFNLSLIFNANISGMVQFMLSNWTNSIGQTMVLQNSTLNGYYATLRDISNSSRYSNITNQYTSQGLILQNCCSTTTAYTLILKMIIPAGTPSSSSWGSTYSMIFRST